MIDAIIYIVIVASIGAILWIVSRGIHSRGESIYVSRKDDADFWTGKAPPDDGFTPAQKREIYQRDHGRCQISGRKVWLGEPGKHEQIEDAFRRLAAAVPGLKVVEKQQGEIDHIVPRKMGGPSSVWNGWLVAREFNRGRGGKFGKWSKAAERLCHRRGYKVYLTPEEMEDFKRRTEK